MRRKYQKVAPTSVSMSPPRMDDFYTAVPVVTTHFYNTVCQMASATNNSRGVWIFARPMQFGTIFGSQFVNHGKYPFCHWGVLVTSLDFTSAQRILGEIDREIDEMVLGTMWDLLRDVDGNNIIHAWELSVSDVKEQWNMFSAEYLGRTTLMDEETHNEGMDLQNYVY